VPALVDGDLKLFESLAIVFHLGDRYGEAKGLWPKSGTDARSEAYVLSVWAMVELQHNTFEWIRHAGAHPRMSLPKDKQVKESADRAHAAWKHATQLLDQRLAGRDFLLGDAFTLVDVVVASVVMIGPMLANLPVEEKHVSDWVARCQSRPALARAIAT
jgi:glutathione S-transferase